MKKKTCYVLGQVQTFIITSCKKNIQKFIHMKKCFWRKKDMQSFFKVIMLAHCILFAHMCY